MFLHKKENNLKVNPTFYSRSSSCPNIYHYVPSVKEEAPKSVFSKSLECLKFEMFHFSRDNEEHSSEDDDSYSSSDDSISDYEGSSSKIMDANYKEETPFEEKILITENKNLQSAFHLPSSSAKSEFCCDCIIKKQLIECVHKTPEKKNAQEDASSSDSELSETFSRSLRIKPPFLKQSAFKHCSSAPKGSVTEPSTLKKEGPRSEGLPPIQTDLQNESLYPIQDEQVLETIFLPQRKSFLRWKPERQSPFLTGTQVRVSQNLRGQISSRGARSYTTASSGRGDVERTLENIHYDYELSFQERRRRCQTRYPRVRITFANEPRIGWSRRIRLFVRDIRRGVQNFFNRRST
ncbi:hypothetical protein TNIN_67731 [Trichonephila inaurata madagascariensis]|uniref:Uncharacterized protein n=1 Tax=Trichonephila inaurata madagascariensis TaxID=2747483 RepID=A0A8X6YTG3_9ARAC|nr:hypothetical protein TNIN_67731 [Trichonephila inaurata madagascariensis]